MPIATRLTNTGTLLVNGNFDENSLDSGSISFNGSQNLSPPSNNALQQLTNPFTVEAWIYPTVVGGVQNSIVSTRTPDVQDAGWDMFIDTNGKLVWGTRNVRYITGTTTLTVNTWSHVALVRSSTTSATLYLNGGSQGTATVSATQNFTNNTLTVGGGYTGSLTSFRLVKGVAVYSGAFTPPQAILPAVTGTSLLLNVIDSTNFITDGSTNNFTVTNTGTATWNATGPYNQGSTTLRHRLVNPASVSGSTVEITNEFDEMTLDAGSISFNGSTQYLSLANDTSNQMGTGDWTAEAWIYITSYALLNPVWAKGGTTTDWFIGTRVSTGRLYIGIGATDYFTTTGPVVSLNEWHHVALVRSGTTLSTYLDGILGNTLTGVTENFASTGELRLGRGRDTSSNYLTGYISSARLVKGTAVYTAAFTPPQSILPAITGTSLLLNVINSTNFITDGSPNNFTVTNNGTATWNTSSPFNATSAVSRQISDGTLQVTTAFDEFTGAPVVDTSLQLWLDSGQTISYPGTGSTWTDLSGQTNTGTLNNTPTFSATVGGGTFLFNGTNQTATTASLNLQQDFTLEAWVNQNVLNGFAIFGQGTQTINNGLHIWYTANTTIRFGMYGNDTDFTVSNSTGTWYHMIFTYDHSSPYTKGFYLNGVVKTGSIVTGPAAYTGSGTFRLGATYSTGGNFGNGYFQGVKMYNRILTADEVTTNFNALRGRFGI